MNIKGISNSITCNNCNNLIPLVKRNCPTCNEDAGVPNVRAVLSKSNIDELEKRFNKILSQEVDTDKINSFVKFVDNNSCVVITMPTIVLNNLLTDHSQIYSNYENLVNTGVRKPAHINHDSHRIAVGGLLFGSYANEIRYGVLSGNGDGLSTYGDVHCKIKMSAIMKRTTFLEENSYDFVVLYDISPGKSIPPGHTSDWSRKSILAAIKLVDKIVPCDADKWADILFSCDGTERSNDDFIEAHIFGGFDSNAIESIKKDKNKNFSRSEKLELDIAFAKFKLYQI